LCLRSGPDDFVVQASPAWQLASAQAILTMGDRAWQKATVSAGRGAHELRFQSIADLGSPFAPGPIPAAVVLTVRYPGMRDLHLHLRTGNGPLVGAAPAPAVDGLPVQPVAFGRAHGYRLWAVSVANTTLLLDGTAQQAAPELRNVPAGSPATTPAAPAAVPEGVPGPAFPVPPAESNPVEIAPPVNGEIVPPLPAVRKEIRGLPVLSSPEFELQ
jgi:hypothetical protein